MSLGWLGSDWELLDPWFLLLLPIVAVTFVWSVRQGRAALPAASLALMAGLPRSLRSRLIWLPPALLSVGVGALVVALARPVARDVMPIDSEGVDILLVLDTSSSMTHNDADDRGNTRRIDAAREQAIAFAESRVHDRVGLVTFARFADLRCPPTLDSKSLASFVRGVDTVPPRSEEDGTAIGTALATSTALLQDVDAASKVVVLLTDGSETVFRESNPEHGIDPREAAKLAADAGVKVYTIGLGQDMRDMFGMVHRPDFGLIEFIARKTGGQFFRARTADDLADVYAEIDRLEKRELEDPRYRTTDWFVVPLLLGGGLLALALLLEFLWIRGLP